MNRDPTNFECTRDPIFLLQVGVRQWTQIPDGLETDGDGIWVNDISLVDDWILPHLDSDRTGVDTTAAFWADAEKQQNDHGWPFVYVVWLPEGVFLTRDEGENYAKARSYRWELWKVYCLPCEGELARILREHQPAESSLLEVLSAYGEVKKKCDQLLAEQFPVGSQVELTLNGKDKIRASVAGYVPGAPDKLSLLFENGNVWDKRVSQIIRVVADDTR